MIATDYAWECAFHGDGHMAGVHATMVGYRRKGSNGFIRQVGTPDTGLFVRWVLQFGNAPLDGFQ